VLIEASRGRLSSRAPKDVGRENGQKCYDLRGISAPLTAVDGSPLFLSYNSVDRASVVAVQKLLEARGITTFLDRDRLSPGLPWPVALEEGLRGVRAVAVFIGRELGGWQKREMWFALDHQVREEKRNRPFPVIPVLLAGADLTPSFLFLNTWIDLRDGVGSVAATEPLAAFEHAIIADGRAPAPTERLLAVCPYRGLEAFREEHAAFFAGRTAFASELLRFTLGKQLVAVVGPSGSGKSSVVQAGLVPLLRHQLPPETTWDVVTFTPGTDPFLRLASALAPHLEQGLSETDRLAETQKLGDRLAGGEIRFESLIDRVIEKSNGTGRLLLVADQFEELFTLAPESKRRPFAAALLAALGKAHFTLLVTLRADFYSQIITLDRELSDLLAPAQVNIGALSRDELRESITGPARLVGLEFEVGLVDRILHDVGSEPGNLPLLEFALTGLWSKREGRTLTNTGYDEIGGVAGALAQRAEAEFSRFAPDEQTAVRRLLSRLVRVARPEEGAEDTRQRIELQATDPLAEKVAQALAKPDVRLLVMGRHEGNEPTRGLTVEVAHEALIRNWTRLRGWLNEDREFLLWRQRTQIQVEQWEQNGRDASYLLRGISLSEADRWLVGRPQDLTAPEQKFIQDSIGLRKREHEEEELFHQTRALADAQKLRADAEAKSAQNLRRAVFSLAVAFALAVAAIVLASLAWRVARDSARTADLAKRQAEKNASDALEIARKTSVYVWDAQAQYAEKAIQARREGNSALAEYYDQRSIAARAAASLNEEFVSRAESSKPVSSSQQTVSFSGLPVKHLIVVMLENRSFDHMLGALKAINPQIDGLTGNESNRDATGRTLKVQPLANFQGQLDPDPDHHFKAVDLQIFGGDTRPSRVPNMQGFVRSYADQRGGTGSQSIMYYFRSDKLPVLATLATEFAVCDHWFSSVPGPTTPNLAFADYGTSFGQVGMTVFYAGEPYKSIFERMAENRRTAKVYRYEAASSTLERVSLMQHHPEFFGTFEQFLASAQKGNLPDYSFIEPNYNDHQGLDGEILANDEHPDHNVQEGERFIATVYNALRQNEVLWRESALLITYSNHGGIYDHLVPPAATPDGFVAPPSQTGTGKAFAFDRLGVRVPAVIVSPYIPKGTIDHTVYDHASIPATLSKLFLNSPQTVSPRERSAHTFDHLLTLTTPRPDTDTPTFRF